MTQKVLKIGTSTAVTIPKSSLDELGLKLGDNVTVKIDKRTKTVIIQSQNQITNKDAKIAQLTLNFINRYRKDLESLAHK